LGIIEDVKRKNNVSDFESISGFCVFAEQAPLRVGSAEAQAVASQVEEQVIPSPSRLYATDFARMDQATKNAKKCSREDKRTFHLCPQISFFDPSARVYFDTGTDDVGEIDLFRDGSLDASLDFISVYLPLRFGPSEFADKWSWGPAVGVGLSSPADDSDDGTAKAADAPVVLMSGGLLLEYKFGGNGNGLDNPASFGIEFGVARGFSASESLGDTDDTARYVGLRFTIPASGRK
jgi:hypothetical protein